jgi:hypothetical protein
MRLQEIFSDEEWQRLEQLIYASTYKALTAYQQQHATHQSITSKPPATFKPLAAKAVKSLARKAKRPPHAAPPKPLPKPQHLPQAKAEATPVYRPVKTVKPLPPTTRTTVAKKQSTSNKAVQQVMPLPPDMDQAARRMLPPDKRGPNPMDLLSP